MRLHERDPSPLLKIDPEAVYPAAELGRFGLGAFALRKAYRKGLRKFRMGRRTFVAGQDLIDYMQKGEQENASS